MGSVPHKGPGTREQSNARSGDRLELLGTGYGTERPNRLVVDVDQAGAVKVGIHRPATRDRATALITLEEREGSQLLEYLSERLAR